MPIGRRACTRCTSMPGSCSSASGARWRRSGATDASQASVAGVQRRQPCAQRRREVVVAVRERASPRRARRSSQRRHLQPRVAEVEQPSLDRHAARRLTSPRGICAPRRRPRRRSAPLGGDADRDALVHARRPRARAPRGRRAHRGAPSAPGTAPGRRASKRASMPAPARPAAPRRARCACDGGAPQRREVGPGLVDRAAVGAGSAHVEADADHRVATACRRRAQFDQDAAELAAAGDQVVRPLQADALAERVQRLGDRDADHQAQSRTCRAASASKRRDRLIARFAAGGARSRRGRAGPAPARWCCGRGTARSLAPANGRGEQRRPACEAGLRRAAASRWRARASRCGAAIRDSGCASIAHRAGAPSRARSRQAGRAQRQQLRAAGRAGAQRRALEARFGAARAGAPGWRDG